MVQYGGEPAPEAVAIGRLEAYMVRSVGRTSIFIWSSLVGKGIGF